MQLDGTILRLSATDLAKQIACRHLVELERAAAEGRLDRPYRNDPTLELLLERGLAHERAYVAGLRTQGRNVVELRDVEGATATDRTIAAMRAGAGAIVQGALEHGRWRGRADVLLRVERHSELGAWSYEVVDTKLAQETRGGTVLQLCLYSDLLGRAQGLAPARMHVVTPGEPVVTESFRLDDYAAYYRLIRRRLEGSADAAATAPALYPDPVPHCDVCAWWSRCERRRRADDHLSLVAGMQSLHRVELERQGIPTLETFAGRSAPGVPILPERPKRGSMETFERLHGQARVQLAGRRADAPIHELLPLEPERGLSRLPPPSANDVFFDLESDPFVEGGGIEYWFGWACREDGTPDPVYRSIAALDRAGERRALEEFLDFVMQRWRDDPTMHVYHFSPYEPAAIKRLVGRHARRESDVDRLLRGQRFVDLHAVTRQGVRASVERNSLKDLERFTGFQRAVNLQDASRALQRVSSALERRLPVPDDDIKTVEGYNRDDCLSTAVLRDWLERLRDDHAKQHDTEVPRPAPVTGDPSETVEERDVRVREVFDRLVAGLAEDRDQWNPEERARWLLAHTLDYFRREEKCAWWEFFRLHGLDPEDLLHERKAISGLRFQQRTGGTDKCPIHRYDFPPQEAALDEGDEVHEVGGAKMGAVTALDQAQRTIDIKKMQAAASVHPSAILVNEHVRSDLLDASLLELARSVAEHGVDGAGSFRATRDLLLKRPPRLEQEQQATALRRDDESATDAAVRLVAQLDHGTLAIQGPPGSGKTHAGARMIVRLARDNRRIGITAVSHRVIRNLLEEVLKAAQEERVAVEVVHKLKKTLGEPPGLKETDDNDEALHAAQQGRVVGGTSWLWARDDAAGALDYLFIDEAGQLSLAQLLASGRAATNLVLLGDPQQLEQPQQGTHPEGSGVSALEHLLDGHETIPPQTGLFLDRTWRLHPQICRFTSEVYYEGRLESREGLERQALDGVAPFDGSGLFYVPVSHAGNQNTSAEEVDAVARIVELLLRPGAGWTDINGVRRQIEGSDILVVAPYNAHVGAIARRLPHVRVGTVDKFQGQQAPVVVYTMASSSIADAPRGMEFLFNPNRLNVATSRARCACILVASPALMEPDCRTPEQIRWANGLCRLFELAREVGVEGF